MKYIKKYEVNVSPLGERINVGDYIFLADPERWAIIPIVKIIEVKYVKNGVCRYYISSYFKNNLKEEKFWIYGFEVGKKLTPKETEKFKLEIDANKYNL
jgi:hypothetical protein